VPDHKAFDLSMTPPLVGLVAAPFTPFQPTGELALEIIPRQAALLARNGVAGAFICGTTGEGSSLTSDERRRVAEAWRTAAPVGLKLAVHVGHLSLNESRALAQHAAQIKADAIATIAPSFFKPATAGDLVAWCREIAAAAPDVPFYYYHMPSMTGVNIPVAEFIRAGATEIPNFVGVKFTFEDMNDYRESLALLPARGSVLFGRDEIFLDALQMGARGAVGSTYNYAAPIYQRVIRAHEAGDLDSARQHQARAVEFINIMNRVGGLAAGKSIMKLIGIDCGPVRLPLTNLTPGQEKDFHAQLRAIGFLDYACRP
jgi:N-acetylneuraminate lyase